ARGHVAARRDVRQRPTGARGMGGAAGLPHRGTCPLWLHPAVARRAAAGLYPARAPAHAAHLAGPDLHDGPAGALQSGWRDAAAPGHDVWLISGRDLDVAQRATAALRASRETVAQEEVAFGTLDVDKRAPNGALWREGRALHQRQACGPLVAASHLRRQ